VPAPLDELHRGQVFISYGSADRPRALPFADRLQAVGFPIWIDRRNIRGGISWDAEVVRGIRASVVVTVLCSPTALSSPHVQQELRLALAFRKPILPLWLEPTAYPDEVQYVLTGRQYLELFDRPEDEWFPQVLSAIEQLCS